MRKKLILILIITLLLFTGCKKSRKDDNDTTNPTNPSLYADEIMKNFGEYTIKFTITNKDKVTEYFVINSKNGLLYNANEKYYLYQESDEKWYTLDVENETKRYDSEGNNNKTKIQNMIRTIMVGYLNTVDDSYTRTQHQTLENYTVEIIKNDSKTFYIVEDDLICVKAVEGTSIIEVKSYTKTADISVYEAYKMVETKNYSSWPSDHPYLKNVREIEYGKFLVGYEDEDGLNLVYNSIGSAIYEEIIKDIKEDGFIDVLEVYNEEGYGKFVATNGKSLQVTLEFSGFSKQLVITFKEIE